MKIFTIKNYNFTLLFSILLGFYSCTTYKTPYGQSFIEYIKPAHYNNIEYSITKGDVVYYIENTLENKTYILWLMSNDTFRVPLQAELPKGYAISKATHLMTAKFNLKYSSKVILINDQYNNVYIKIH